MDKITFKPEHNVIIHPGGGGSIFKPTHRIFPSCSHIPTPREMEESKQKISELIGKVKFPFRFVPLDEGEV